MIDVSIRFSLGAAPLYFSKVRVTYCGVEVYRSDDFSVVKAGLGTHTEVSEARNPHILTRYLQVAHTYRNPGSLRRLTFPG